MKDFEEAGGQGVEGAKIIYEIDPKILENSLSYNQTMLAIGYGGFFAIWGFMRNDISEIAKIWTALLMSISIIIFILNAVFNMYIVSLMAVAKDVKKIDKLNTFIRSKIYVNGWHSMFWLSLGTGCISAIIMFFQFISILVSGDSV